MTIRTKLRVGTIATALLVFVFIVIILLFVSVVGKAYDKQKVAEEVVEHSFQLAMLRTEYAQHPGERAKAQWISLYESSVRLLEDHALLFAAEPEKTLFRQLETSITSLRPLFEELVRNVEQGGNQTVIQEIHNQISIRAQNRTALALQLSEVSREAARTAARNLSFAVIVIGMLVFGISLGFYFVSRKIAQSIQVLGEGTKIIGSGDLAHRLAIQSQDEIGDVARLFNTMSQKLQDAHATLEQAVKERTEELSTVLGALDNVALVSMTDAKGDIIYANDKFVEVSKYAREELIGKNHRVLKSGHQPQSLFIGLWNTISHGKVWRGEIKNRAKDGTYYWVDTSIAPVLNEQGKPVRYISVRFLVTERKRALREIKKFQQAVAASSEAIIILTLPELTVTYINPAWSRLTGHAAEEVLGKRMEYSRAGKTDTKVLDSFREAMREGKMFYSDEFVLQRKDGTDYDAELTMYPVYKEEEEEEETGDENRVLFFVCIHRDITQKKRSEEAKTEFVSLASHQLRTPLTEIRWALSSLEREHLTDEQKEVVGTAHAASSHMAETIKAMLTISHIETGDMSPEPADMNLLTSIEDVIRLYDLKRQEKDLTLTVQCAEKIRMHTDEQLFKEVFSNLLNNAYKYTPNGGKVTISVKENTRHISIDVTDTGYGIPVRDQQNISQKFFRASNIVDMDQEGSGLGLHMSYSLMRLLGGTISFTSQENVGTTFTLTFPRSL